MEKHCRFCFLLLSLFCRQDPEIIIFFSEMTILPLSVFRYFFLIYLKTRGPNHNILINSQGARERSMGMTSQLQTGVTRYRKMCNKPRSLAITSVTQGVSRKPKAQRKMRNPTRTHRRIGSHEKTSHYSMLTYHAALPNKFELVSTILVNLEKARVRLLCSASETTQSSP